MAAQEKSDANRTIGHGQPAQTWRVRAVLDNVRSTFNVGSIFRTADGVGVWHLDLCGITPTPAHPKVAKTALGAQDSVAWRYHRNGLECVLALKQQGVRLVALESSGARSLFAPAESPVCAATDDIALIVGNEVCGVDPGILAISDEVIAVPMLGIKQSLNVAIAFGVAVYWWRGRYEVEQRE